MITLRERVNVDQAKLKELEDRVEWLRRQLNKEIGNEYKKLSSTSALSLSNELDALITAYMRAKLNRNRNH